MAKFKKITDYPLEPADKQEILAEEMINTTFVPIDLFDVWNSACEDMIGHLNALRPAVSSSLIDETILSIASTRTLTQRVKVKLG